MTTPPPPRRPKLPAEYVSSAYCAAAHAARVAALKPAKRAAFAAQLRRFRDELAASLEGEAPPWEEMSAGVEGLAHALDATQCASGLVESLGVLESAPRARVELYPVKMVEALKETGQISANLAVLERVRVLAVQLRELELGDAQFGFANCSSVGPLSMSASMRSQSWTPSPPVLPSRSTTDFGVPQHYADRAAVVANARAAATSPALAAIPALDSARTTLQCRFDSLRTELEGKLLDGVFGYNLSYHALRPPPSAPSASISNAGMQRVSSSQALPPSSPSPALSGGVITGVARALDVLCGKGSAARCLDDAAEARLDHIFQQLLLVEDTPSPPPPPGKTVASSAGSSFTSAAAQTNTTTMHSGTSISSRYVQNVLGKEASEASKDVCGKLVSRMHFQLIAVLRRLVILSDAFGRENSGMPDVVHAIWQHMELRVVSLVNALLGCEQSMSAAYRVLPMSGGDVFSCTASPDEHPKISLLSPSSPTASKAMGEASTSWDPLRTPPPRQKQQQPSIKPQSHWSGEQSTGCLDRIALHVKGLSNFAPSIYNLELMHSEIQHFAHDCNRLITSWSSFRRGHDADGDANGGSVAEDEPSSGIAAHLQHLTDLFMGVVRRDVKLYMQDALGIRAAALLQPPLSRARALDLVPSASHVLPLLPHTHKLAEIIASCISISICVPSLSRSLGELVSAEILHPFARKAGEALSLAESWTDAGAIVDELVVRSAPTTASASPTATTVGEMLPVAPSVSSSSRAGIRNRRDALVQDRNKDAAVQCLANLVDSECPSEYQQAAVLVESEWKAVVRLVASVSAVVAEVERCGCMRGELQSGGGGGGAKALLPLVRLRTMLRERSADVRGQSYETIREVVGRTQAAMLALEQEVIERGVLLLHAEVVLRCFASVTWTLQESVVASRLRQSREEEERLELLFETFAAGDDLGDSQRADSFDHFNDGGGFHEPFGSSGVYEFDEFGDPIVHNRAPGALGSRGPTKASSFALKSELVRESPTSHDGDGSLRTSASASTASPVVSADAADREDPVDSDTQGENDFTEGRRTTREALSGRSPEQAAALGGQSLGENLSNCEQSVRFNISPGQLQFVLQAADEAVALGFRVSASRARPGDLNLGTSASMFFDTAAVAAPDIVGWSSGDASATTDATSEAAAACRALRRSST